MRHAVVVLGMLLLAASLAGASGAAPAQATKLIATVGPEFTVSLTDAQGSPVTQLAPGAYEIEVHDRSDFHTLHLQGPGVDERTEVAFTGTVTWRVTLRDGIYTFFCDVHPTTMRGMVTSGTPPVVTPPPPGGGGSGGGGPGNSGAIPTGTRLVLTSGPSQVIRLRTAAGRAVRSVRRGTYTVTVQDRGRLHNARLRGPGYNRATTVSFVGRQTWRVRLARTGTLRFLCDPHASLGMRGSARIVP